MIYVQELSPPIKLPGRCSVAVKFQNYNEEVVNKLKSLQPSVFHKKELFWEISYIYLAELLDFLVYYDEVVLKLAAYEEPVKLSPMSEEEISALKVKPFSHQVEAVNYGLEHRKWLLLDSMGCGKTNSAIVFAETLKRRGLIDHCLIICGVDSLRQNFKNEIKEFSNESVTVLGERLTKTGKIVYETLKRRAEILQNKIDEFFVITNATNVGDDGFITAFKKSVNKFGLIIVDEVHRFSKNSSRGSNLLKLTADFKVALTGTPITNSPISAYLPLAWTENDMATLTNFKSFYCDFGGFKNSQIIGYKNLDILRDEIESCSLRRTLAQIKDTIPKKTVEYEVIEMTPQHEKFYEAIKDGVKEAANKIELKTNNLLALTTRLRQATSAPSVLTTETVESSKVLRTAELVTDLLESGEKVMVLSMFVEPTLVLAEKLKEYNPLLGSGNLSDPAISDNISKFRKSKDFNLLIGTHQKIGTGFNMPECQYMICLDTPFTAAQLDQSIDRIYRITSEKPIFVKILICKNTIDERVREIVETKRELADYLVDGQPTQIFSDMLKDIILSL